MFYKHIFLYGTFTCLVFTGVEDFKCHPKKGAAGTRGAAGTNEAAGIKDLTLKTMTAPISTSSFPRNKFLFIRLLIQ